MVTPLLPLPPEAHARIAAAVAAVERRTSAHFALAVVPASDRYALYPLASAAIAALAVTAMLALLRPALTIGDGVLVNAALFIGLGLALDWPPLRLRLVPAAVKRRHARHLAQREFALRILAAAPHRNGVLFFVSLGERYVEVLADREIHARVAAGTWERIVADFIAAVKSDRLTEGFIAAVEACGATLAAHYPCGNDAPGAPSALNGQVDGEVARHRTAE
jgi:putative membrane protein